MKHDIYLILRLKDGSGCTLWGVLSFVIFCRYFLTCSTGYWHWALGSYCAAQFITGTSKRRQDKTSRASGRHTVCCIRGSRNPPFLQQYLRSKTVNQRSVLVEEIGELCEVGDWKLLSLLADNMEPLVFGEFIQQLFDRVQARMGFSLVDDI